MYPFKLMLIVSRLFGAYGRKNSRKAGIVRNETLDRPRYPGDPHTRSALGLRTGWAARRAGSSLFLRGLRLASVAPGAEANLRPARHRLAERLLPADADLHQVGVAAGKRRRRVTSSSSTP